MKTITLTDGSRPSLFRAIAEIIESDNPHIPASAVQGETPIATGQLPQIEALFRAKGILFEGEGFLGSTPDAILDWIEELRRRRQH